MKITKRRFQLSRKIKLLLAAGFIIAGTSGVTAFNLLQHTSADEMGTTAVMVQDHEARITKNEKDIASTEDQAKQAQQTADDASQAAASAQQRVTVVERKVETQAASTPTEKAVVPTTSPTPTPTVTGYCLSVDQYNSYKIDCTTGERIDAAQ